MEILLFQKKKKGNIPYPLTVWGTLFESYLPYSFCRFPLFESYLPYSFCRFLTPFSTGLNLKIRFFLSTAGGGGGGGGGRRKGFVCACVFVFSI